MRYIPDSEIQYTRHPLKRAVTVTGFLSADYIEGSYAAPEPHSHRDAWELAYCCGGSLEVQKGSNTVPVNTGFFSLISPGTPHSYTAGTGASRFFVISFTLSSEDCLFPAENALFFCDEFQQNLFSRMIREICNAYDYDRRLEERVKVLDFRTSGSDPFGAEQVIVSCLEMILVYGLRSITMQGEQVVREEGFRKAMQTFLISHVRDYIEENASAGMTVNDIADHFSYSRSYLSATFREVTGKTMKQTITDALLRRAAVLLAEGGKPVSTAAAELGFLSPQYFSHWFRKHTGMPPGSFSAPESR